MCVSVGAVGERIKKKKHPPSFLFSHSLPALSLPPSLLPARIFKPFFYLLNDTGKIIMLFFKDSASHIPISHCVGPTLILLLLGADKGGAIEREGADERENCEEVTGDERMKVGEGAPALPHGCSRKVHVSKRNCKANLRSTGRFSQRKKNSCLLLHLLLTSCPDRRLCRLKIGALQQQSVSAGTKLS